MHFKKDSKAANRSRSEGKWQACPDEDGLSCQWLAFLSAVRLRFFLRYVGEFVAARRTAHDASMSRSHAAGVLDRIRVAEDFPARGTDIARDERSPPYL